MNELSRYNRAHVRKSLAVLQVLLACLPAFAATPKPESRTAREVFEELKSLQGEWKSSDPKNKTIVTYRLLANGSALTETWTMSPTRQSMTVYTMDGEGLLATHYCPQGNAPRLQFVKVDSSGASHFIFRDGTNLQDPQGSHEHAFWIRLEADGRLIRNETYIGNSAQYDPARDKGEPVSFIRLQ